MISKLRKLSFLRAVRGLFAAALVGIALLVGGCGGSARSSAQGGPLQVVAAENFWGSIAAQLGGPAVHVRSIIVNPHVDPHSYEPTPRDAELVDSAQLVIVNGIGYDEWARRLLAGAEKPNGQVTLEVGQVLGLGPGDNPHQWYSPRSVERVIAAITADYIRLRPQLREYFEARRQHFETVDLAAYHRLLEQISQRYAGTPVGYSESIFAPLGEYLHLDLATPAQFAKDVAEGVEVPPQLQAQVEAELEQHKVEVWVYNSQNATPGVKRLNRIASAAGIPIVTITETLDPARDTFQQWQVVELERLATALREGRAR